MNTINDKAFRLEDEKETQYLIDNETGKKIIKFESKLSAKLQNEFMKTVDDNLKMNFIDFYLKWSDKLRFRLSHSVKKIDELIRKRIESLFPNFNLNLTTDKYFAERNISTLVISNSSRDENRHIFMYNLYKKIFLQMMLELKYQLNIRLD